jgi:hypothetical protein
VSRPQATPPEPVEPPVKAEIEGDIPKEQLQRRGLALAPGHVATPAEALAPKSAEPSVPFATGNTMSLDEIKRHGGCSCSKMYLALGLSDG